MNTDVTPCKSRGFPNTSRVTLLTLEFKKRVTPILHEALSEDMVYHAIPTQYPEPTTEYKIVYIYQLTNVPRIANQEANEDEEKESYTCKICNLQCQNTASKR